MEAYPLLTQRRLRYFFLEEFLRRRLNVLILELCPMLNPFNNNHSGKKTEDIALRKMYLERMIQLDIMHLKRLATSYGRLKYDNDSDGYKLFKRDPVPPSEYRKKDGRRAKVPTRLTPHLDSYYSQPPTMNQQEALSLTDIQERQRLYWEWEEKHYCPNYLSIPPYGSYDRVQKAIARGKLRVPHDQSAHFYKMLRAYESEDKWGYFTDEMRRVRCLITPAALKRVKKRINRRAFKKRQEELFLRVYGPLLK